MSVSKPPEDRPLYLIHGGATEEEVAAVVAVLQSVAAAGSKLPEREKPGSWWASPARAVRPVLHHGSGGWRASALPR